MVGLKSRRDEYIRVRDCLIWGGLLLVFQLSTCSEQTGLAVSHTFHNSCEKQEWPSPLLR